MDSSEGSLCVSVLRQSHTGHNPKTGPSLQESSRERMRREQFSCKALLFAPYCVWGLRWTFSVLLVCQPLAWYPQIFPASPVPAFIPYQRYVLGPQAYIYQSSNVWADTAREHTKNYMREILSIPFIKLIKLSMLHCPSTSWWLRDWGLTRVSVWVSPLSWVSRADYTFLSNHSSFLSPSFKPFSPPFHVTLISSLLLFQFLAVFVRMCSRKAAWCASEGNQTFLPHPNTKGQSHSPNYSMFVYCSYVPVTGRINPRRT